MNEIILSVLVFAVLGGAMGALLALATKLFPIKKDETVEKITEALPGVNCGGCGYSGCAALAEAIAKGEAKINQCSVGGAESSEKIAEILGKEPVATVKMRAQVMCSGSGDYAKRKYLYEGVDDCVAASKIGGGDKVCAYGCIGLGTCVKACPFEAIKVDNGVAAVDYTKCRGCGVCVTACPKSIIKLIPYDSKHWIGCASQENGKATRDACGVGCIACKICEKNCSAGAVRVVNNTAVIDYEKCTGCGVCADKCPRHIIWSAEKQGELGLSLKRT